MQQQHQPPMATMGAMPPLVITTEQIQKYLDENKQLILAILDNQNLGKLAECAQYQAQLQKNLLYLAAIADSQPPAAVRPPQVIPHAGMHPVGGQLMQQAPIYRPQAPLPFNPQEGQEQPQQQQQLHHHPQMMPFQGHMGMRPVGVMNGMHPPMYAQASHGPGSSEVPPGSQNTADLSRGSMPSGPAAGATASEPTTGDGQKSAATDHASSEAEPSSNSKRPEGAKTP